MTLPIERARTRKPITWLTVIGVILLPVVIGGILVAALYNPTERLSEMTAAIVNNDEPVTINDQVTPLGRQLTAGLVEGSDDLASNLTWVVSNTSDAAEGLADGTYQAVVTIPENFSAAATSGGQAIGGTGTPEQATISVSTPPDARIVDDAISAQVTQAAASVMGSTISSATLDNVFLGFTTLGDQLGSAADGAHQLADGARQAADGAAALPSGAAQLADGATGIATGAGSLGSGLDTIASGISQSSSGATQLAGGVRQVVAGVGDPQLVNAANTAAAEASTSASQTAALAASVGGVAQTSGGLSATLGDLSAQCSASGGSAQFCSELADAAGVAASTAGAAGAAAGDAVTAARSAGTASGYAGPTASGIQTLTTQTSAGLTEIANQTDALASGLGQLASGTTRSADGARALESGASQLADGATQLSTGAGTLATGVSTLADGTSSLADGLTTAASSLPSYTDSEAQNLADVVSNPVTADGAGTSLFGASAVPLLATLALWVGGLASFIALQAVTRRALASRRPSALLALRSFAPGALIGLLQGLAVAAVVQSAASYSWADWWAFAGIAALTGVAFAAVNQALVALLRGFGRWVAALVAVLVVATGVVSTIPGWLAGIAGFMPTAPAYDAMLGALAGAGGIGAGIAGLVIWTVMSLAVTMIVVTRKRSIAVRDLVATSAVPA
ncbi:YhgE/Pip family protein [Microbacterium sp. P03]|uniref:YhgE/Pip family protein n=1 Tax=Microbacterium sp. P03 TaxID=3366946 RepID=UPI0037467C94